MDKEKSPLEILMAMAHDLIELENQKKKALHLFKKIDVFTRDSEVWENDKLRIHLESLTKEGIKLLEPKKQPDAS